MSEENKPRIARSSSGRKKLTPEQRRKRKIIQISLGLVVFIVICILAAVGGKASQRGGFLLFVGVALGYVLQRSRFCFTAALRDPVLTGGTYLTKAVIIAFAVSTVLFLGLNIARFGLTLENFDMARIVGNVPAVGVHTAIGAFIFGIGAVIAGGCASGTLMRMGEGFVQQWLAFVFFVIGSVLGVGLMNIMRTSSFLYSGNRVFFPDSLGGWIPAIILQFGLLLILYIAVDLWEKKKSGAL